MPPNNEYSNQRIILFIYDEIFKTRFWKVEWIFIALSFLMLVLLSYYIFGFYISITPLISIFSISILSIKLVQKEKQREEYLKKLINEIINNESPDFSKEQL